MNFLKDLRSIAGITQAQLAERISIAHGSIRNIESKDLPISYSLASRISGATGCGFWLYHKDYDTPGKGEILKMEGVEVSKADNGLVRKLALTQKYSVEPFTKDYYEAYRKESEKRLFRGAFSGIAVSEVKTLLRESEIKGVQEKVICELRKQVKKLASNYGLMRDKDMQYYLTLEGFEDAEKQHLEKAIGDWL